LTAAACEPFSPVLPLRFPRIWLIHRLPMLMLTVVVMVTLTEVFQFYLVVVYGVPCFSFFLVRRK
jgi:hypothetical protein